MYPSTTWRAFRYGRFVSSAGAAVREPMIPTSSPLTTNIDQESLVMAPLTSENPAQWIHHNSGS
jgi:hypothetical protein